VVAEDVHRDGDVEQDAAVQREGDHLVRMVKAHVGKI